MKYLLLIPLFFLAACGGGSTGQSSEGENVDITVESPEAEIEYENELPTATFEIEGDGEVIVYLNEVELVDFESGDVLPAVEGENLFEVSVDGEIVISIPFTLTLTETEECILPPIKGDSDRLQEHLDCVHSKDE